MDRAAQLICEEEAHRDGKHEEIAHRNTKIKHHRAKRERDSRSAHLFLVKCRSDKRPQQIKQHGKRKNNGKPQRQIDVCEKLSRQIIVDDFNVEIAGRKRLKSGNAARNVGNSFFQSAPADANPLWFLGKSLELLAGADIAYFTKDWEEARGCRIEHTCALEYGIETVVEDYTND